MSRSSPPENDLLKKICIVTASPMTLSAFMSNHVKTLSARYEVSVVADFPSDDLSSSWLPGVRRISIPIARTINPLADARALFALFRLFLASSFDIVHSITPKAGLLAMSAAKIARVPHRIHWFTGQVWATRQGISRRLLKGADRVIATNANNVLVDSSSQRRFLESEGVLKRGYADVLGQGSISGVDLHRFRPDPEIRIRIRDQLGIPRQACLVLFVGRLKHDKGVLDLAQAFAKLANLNRNIWLAVVGPDEAGMGTRFQELCGSAIERVKRIDFTPAPEHYMAASDLLVLPSYREGFGSVVIEAAACGVPAVASRIYGLMDAVVEGVTGLLHPPGDIEILHMHLAHLCSDPILRQDMGDRARVRVKADFSMETVTANLLEYYDGILALANPG